MTQELQNIETPFLEGIKKRLDPAFVLNPGKLGFSLSEDKDGN